MTYIGENFFDYHIRYEEKDYVDNIHSLHNKNHNVFGSLTLRCFRNSNNFMIINFGVCQSKKGYGTKLLGYLIKKLEIERKSTSTEPYVLYCEIEKDNIASQKLFEKLNFNRCDKENNLTCYHKDNENVFVYMKKI